MIELVDQAVDAESKIKRETPGLIILMNKPRTVDKNLIALGDLSSTYRDSFCGDDQLKYDERPQFHYERPEVECGGGSQLNKAARVLASGTLKSTYHIPGYRGHVPANIRNPKKYEHSQGRDVHPVYNNLVLSQRGMGCVLGYTGKFICLHIWVLVGIFMTEYYCIVICIGHVPIEPSDGQYHERKTACDPRTTTGAGFCGTRTML